MNALIIKASHREGAKLLNTGNAITVSMIHVLCGATLIAVVVLLFDSAMDEIKVGLGLHYYAESLSPLSTQWLPMPFNTMVNLGYIAVGIYWILHVRGLLTNGRMSVDEAYLIYVTAWMLMVYGPVQLVRVITHWHVAGILDQWYTLPIFAWVGVSCRAIVHKSGGLDVRSAVLIITASVASYGLAVVYTYGFELALGAHICGVVVQAWLVYKRTRMELGRQKCRSAFIRAVLCCAGFVSLKLGDWHLVSLLPMLFAVLSGHFWSKIADFMQAHYACRFLEAAMSARLHSEVESVSCHKHK